MTNVLLAEPYAPVHPISRSKNTSHSMNYHVTFNIQGQLSAGIYCIWLTEYVSFLTSTMSRRGKRNS